MKKLLVFAMMSVAAAGAFAEPSYAFISTTGAEGETTTGYVERYAAYLCTTAAAAELFGGNNGYESITTYLAANAVNFAPSMTPLEHYGDGFDDGEYSFIKQYPQSGGVGSLANGSYIAIVAYTGDDGYRVRVFESMASGGVLEFDPVNSFGSAGAWTPTAVPEPSSGLLLLLGLAGLALKRRRMPA